MPREGRWAAGLSLCKPVRVPAALRPRPLSATVPMPYHPCAQSSNDVRRVRCASWRVFCRPMLWAFADRCIRLEESSALSLRWSRHRCGLRGFGGRCPGLCISCTHNRLVRCLDSRENLQITHQAIWQEKAEKAAEVSDGVRTALQQKAIRPARSGHRPPLPRDEPRRAARARRGDRGVRRRSDPARCGRARRCVRSVVLGSTVVCNVLVYLAPRQHVHVRVGHALALSLIHI